MNDPVVVPFWLLALIVAFALASLMTHGLVPSVRWFFRRRMERAVARLNLRLDRPIEPFKLMARNDMIVRLVHDPAVAQAVADHARDEGIPETVVLQEARAYAREIVPAFSATLYFGVAIKAARRLSRALYRVRIAEVDAALGAIDRRATVIFVMNHRSNMDYVLVTWLVSERSAISYAVGEWARVWPLSRLIRSMGAYFIRRGSRNALYRRVLARYVQMASAEGATQAFFPEGGLSLDGRVGAPRMGLISYILQGFDPAGRDVVFVPVGLAYDRVLEDRLLTDAALAGTRTFRARPLGIAAFVGRMVWRMARGRWTRFGTAAAGFGAPVSLRRWRADHPYEDAEPLGALLMARVVRAVPVLPVPLVAAAVGGGIARADLPESMAALVARLQGAGASLRLPVGKPGVAMIEGLVPLLARGILAETGGYIAAAPGMDRLLDFYAAPVLQRLDDSAAVQQT